jgi:hypothetical protein
MKRSAVDRRIGVVLDDFDEMWVESARLGLEATSDPKTTDPVVRLGFSVTRKQVKTALPTSGGGGSVRRR